MSRSPWAGSTAVEEALGATPDEALGAVRGTGANPHTHTQIR